jgi:hypothetical protein
MAGLADHPRQIMAVAVVVVRALSVVLLISQLVALVALEPLHQLPVHR